VQERRDQVVEEVRKAERARDLLAELERQLGEDNPEPEPSLAQLERLAQSLPEADTVRLLVESAVGNARTHRAIKALSDVSRARSAIEGKISTLQASPVYRSE
jgi:hypothetical protein